MKVCVAVIALGDSYLQMYKRLFKNSHESYAKRCGYDYKLITDFISKERHPDLITLNKILVCSCDWSKEYDMIIYIDADILISKSAPPIDKFYDFKDKIGVVSQGNQPKGVESRHSVQRYKGWEVRAKDYYMLHCGEKVETDIIINTGLLVLQPKKHRLFLDSIFSKYKKKRLGHRSANHYEQAVVGFEIMKKDLALYIDMKWNAIWPLGKCYYNDILKESLSLQDYCDSNYFVHLCGQLDWHLVPKIK
jgi:hypothetical protein